MKKTFLTFITLVALSASLWAQAPQAFNYQGVARDLSGTAMATKNISVKASILDGSLTGTVVYAETHAIATNQFGLFTLAIGTGTVSSGTFANTNWASGNKYLKIEIDPNGGSSYSLSGTTQLLSVPYAMYAASAGDSKWSENNVGINYNGGKVGIGTSNPAWALTIEKNASGSDRNFVMLNNTNNGNDATAGLTVQVGTDPTEVLSLGYGGSNYSLVPNSASRANIQSKNLALRATSSTGDISFHVGGFENEKMRINASGRVGIGTIAPSATLHTNGTVRLQGLTNNNTLTNALVTDASGNVFTKDISTLGNSQWTNVTGGISYINGNVGIRTVTPEYPIDILGNFDGNDRTQIRINNTSTSSNSTANIGIAAGGTGGAFSVFSDNYFPTGLPFYTGRVRILSQTQNGLLLETENAVTGNIEFATGAKTLTNGTALSTPVRMIVTSSGNVGIGTITPSAKLHTNGTVRLQGLTSNNTLTNALVTDANGNVFTKDISTLGTSQWTSVTGGINYSGGKVGIGTNTPISPLNIVGNFTDNNRNAVELKNTSTANNSYLAIAMTSGSESLLSGSRYNRGAIAVHSDTYFPTNINSGYLALTGMNKGVLINGLSPTADIKFLTGGNFTTDTQSEVRMTIGSDGNIGLGTTTPKSKLQITSGDVYLDDATKGIIMKNTAGQCYRVTVGTAGALVSTLITCP